MITGGQHCECGVLLSPFSLSSLSAEARPPQKYKIHRY